MCRPSRRFSSKTRATSTKWIRMRMRMRTLTAISSYSSRATLCSTITTFKTARSPYRRRPPAAPWTTWTPSTTPRTTSTRRTPSTTWGTRRLRPQTHQTDICPTWPIRPTPGRPQTRRASSTTISTDLISCSKSTRTIMWESVMWSTWRKYSKWGMRNRPGLWAFESVFVLNFLNRRNNKIL